MDFLKAYMPTVAGYHQVQMGIERVRAKNLWPRDQEEEVAVWFKGHEKLKS